MQITKSKGVEDIEHMEEKLKEMGRELSGLRDIEAIMRNQLETENAWLKGTTVGKGESIGRYGQFLFGSNLM